MIPSLTRGGTERVRSLLTHEWAKCHDVAVAAFDASRPAYDYHGRIVHLGLRLPSHALAKVYMACASTLLLIKLLRTERPDRVIAFMEQANFPAILASALLDTLDRLVVSVRHNPNMLSFPRRLLIRRLYRLPLAAVAVSDGARRALVAMGGLPTGSVTTIPNPVSLPDTPHHAVTTRHPHRFVLAAGRLVPDKGFDMPLTAFSQVEPTNLHLVILGDGPERDRLLSLAQQLRVSDPVWFPSEVPDIAHWYRRAECFVLRSRNEGWPNVLLEEMAAGCPVVSFRCDYGPTEIVQHRTSGLLVAAGDVEALSHAIARVVTNRRLSASLSVGGGYRAVCFASQIVAPRWLKL